MSQKNWKFSIKEGIRKHLTPISFLKRFHNQRIYETLNPKEKFIWNLKIRIFSTFQLETNNFVNHSDYYKCLNIDPQSYITIKTRFHRVQLKTNHMGRCPSRIKFLLWPVDGRPCPLKFWQLWPFILRWRDEIRVVIQMRSCLVGTVDVRTQRSWRWRFLRRDIL
jgi:hypothetical protein